MRLDIKVVTKINHRSPPLRVPHPVPIDRQRQRRPAAARTLNYRVVPPPPRPLLLPSPSSHFRYRRCRSRPGGPLTLGRSCRSCVRFRHHPLVSPAWIDCRTPTLASLGAGPEPAARGNVVVWLAFTRRAIVLVHHLPLPLGLLSLKLVALYLATSAPPSFPPASLVASPTSVPL